MVKSYTLSIYLSLGSTSVGVECTRFVHSISGVYCFYVDVTYTLPPKLPSCPSLRLAHVPFLGSCMWRGFWGAHEAEISNQISALAGLWTSDLGCLMAANVTTRLPRVTVDPFTCIICMFNFSKVWRHWSTLYWSLYYWWRDGQGQCSSYVERWCSFQSMHQSDCTTWNWEAERKIPAKGEMLSYSLYCYLPEEPRHSFQGKGRDCGSCKCFHSRICPAVCKVLHLNQRCIGAREWHLVTSLYEISIMIVSFDVSYSQVSGFPPLRDFVLHFFLVLHLWS